MNPVSLWRALALTAALSAATLAAATMAAAAPLSLDQALELAVSRSEASRAARAGVSSARAALGSAGQFADPTLRAGIDNLPVDGPDRFDPGRDFMTMKRIGISQEWLPAGKRAARQAAALSQLGRETALAQSADADTRLQTALAYLDAWYAGETAALTLRTEQQLQQESATATARLASAATTAGGAAEALALSAALGLAEDETAAQRQLEAAARVALERWTGVAAAALSPPGRLPPPAEADWVAAHPLLRVAEREVEVARQALAVARAERQSNWTWEVAYAQRTGRSDMVSVGVTIPLQVAPQQRQDREIASRLARVEQAEAALAEASRAASAEHRALASDRQRLQQRIERYRAAVLAPAQQRTTAALAAYGANQLPLSAVFAARQAEVDLQRKLLELQRALDRTLVQLAYKPALERGAP